MKIFSILVERMYLKNKFVHCLILLILTLFLFIIGSSAIELLNETYFYTFQMRDFWRASELLKGRIYFYGPEMTGGGHLPGPLYYIVLALVFLFSNDWQIVWLLQYLLAFAGSWMAMSFLTEKISREYGILWILFFSISPLVFWILKVFLNVSWLFFFAIYAQVLVLKIFDSQYSDQKNRNFYLFCAIVGIGLQFHLSILFLFFAICFIQFLSKQIGVARLRWRNFFYGLSIFLLPSTPYIFWRVFQSLGMGFGVESFYAGKGGGTLDSLFFLMSEVSRIPYDIFVIGVFKKILFSLPFAFIPAAMALMFKRSDNFFNKHRILLICIGFSFIPYFNWHMSPQAIRYTILFNVCMTFLTVFMLKDIFNDSKTLLRFNRISLFLLMVLIPAYVFYFKVINWSSFFLVFFAFSIVIALILARKKREEASSWLVSIVVLVLLSSFQKINTLGEDLKHKDVLNYMPSFVEWEHIWGTISEYSGWSYEEARDKIYYLGHHMSQSSNLAFRSVEKKQLKSGVVAPSGFIVSNRYFNKGPKNLTKAYLPFYEQWILKQNIQPDLKKAILEESIQIGPNLSSTILIVPYYVVDQSSFPKSFHNNGEGYIATSESRIMNEVRGDQAVFVRNNGGVVFKWNDCPDQGDFCSNGILIEPFIKERNTYRTFVKIYGSSLSQISPWISPNWTQAWINPYVEISCDNKKTRFDIISSVGFRRIYTHHYLSSFFHGNNSFLAPLEKEISFECKGKIESITAGRSGSEVDRVTSVLKLGPAHLTYKF